MPPKPTTTSQIFSSGWAAATAGAASAACPAALIAPASAGLSGTAGVCRKETIAAAARARNVDRRDYPDRNWT
jgi:hypothetical protein